MASYHLYLTAEDYNRFKNKKLVDVVLPIVFSIVTEWGCPKANHETYRIYLERKIGQSDWDRYLKRWKRAEKPKLDETNGSSLDVTFLYKLIPEVCSQVAPANTPVWTEFNVLTLESLLSRCKDIRNDVCHEPGLAAIDPNIPDKVRTLSKSTLCAAGGLYAHIDQTYVNERVIEVEKMVDEIRQTHLSEREKRLALYEKYFRLHGFQEILRHKKTSSVYLPFSNIKLGLKDVYHGMDLLCENEGNNVRELRCSELFQTFENRFVFITGQAGSGKSSLLRRLVDDLLERVEAELFLGIRNFSLLLHVECKDTTVSSCAELIERDFPKIVEKIDDIKDAVLVLRRMRILIAVDGLDEMNQSSYELFNELIQLFGVHGNATFVVTSRPVAVSNWTKVLQEKNMDFMSTSLKLLANDSEQIEFLSRYQDKIPDIAHPELINAFRSLNLENSCMTHFSFPIYLVMFCYLFKTNRENVYKWTSENQIMTYFLKVCEKNMIERLEKPGNIGKNPRTRVADLMEALEGLSFRLLEQGSLEINERTYSDICKKCFREMNVDYPSILSCLFLNDSGKDGFHFVHKSQCEILASKLLVARVKRPDSLCQDVELMKTMCVLLRDDTSSINPNMENSTVSLEAVGGSMPQEVNMKLFLNVLRFALMDLVEEGPQRIAELFLDEMCRALGPLRLGFDFWTEITMSCPNSEMVAKAAARESLATVMEYDYPENRRWTLSTARHLAAVALMLPHHQPPKLCVTARPSGVAPSVRRQLMEAVNKSYTGHLELDWKDSYHQFQSYDNAMIGLQLTRCQLTKFAACVTSSAAQRALAVAVRHAEEVLGDELGRDMDLWNPEAGLWIAVPNLRTHELAALEGTKHRLNFKTRLTRKTADRSPRPLPISQGQVAPTLTVVLKDHQKDPKKIAELLQDLAPENKRYGQLFLQAWPGTDASMDQLLMTLYGAGVRTKSIFDDGDTPQWYYFISDSDESYDSSCSDKMQGESSHKRCLQLVLPENWTVTTKKEMRYVASLLPHYQPSELIVSLPWQCKLPPALWPLLEAVERWHTGSLGLDLGPSCQKFDAIEDHFTGATLAWCQLTKFTACVDSSAAQRVLIEAVCWEGNYLKLHIAVSDPRTHELAALEGTEHRLRFRTKLIGGASDRQRRPLPVSGRQDRPDLTVVLRDDQKDPEEVAGLIEDLAPEGKRYRRLYLCDWPGTDAALDQLVATLIAAGLRTSVYGDYAPQSLDQLAMQVVGRVTPEAVEPRWIRLPHRGRPCKACERWWWWRDIQPPGETECVELILP